MRPAYYYTHSAATWRTAQVSKPSSEQPAPVKGEAGFGADSDYSDGGDPSCRRQTSLLERPTQQILPNGWRMDAGYYGPLPVTSGVKVAQPTPFAASSYTTGQAGSLPPPTELDAHSDALVTATSRKSCSYTSPERGKQRTLCTRRCRGAPLYITGRPRERREPRLSLTYIAASFVGKHTTHQARIRWAKISVKKCSSAPHLRRKLAPHTRTHTRAHAHTLSRLEHNKQRGRQTASGYVFTRQLRDHRGHGTFPAS